MSSYPYNIQWLNSGYHAILLPGSPWYKIESQISSSLAHEVQLLHNSELQLHVINHLGQRFANEHIVKQQTQPTNSQPVIKDDDIDAQARRWLEDTMEKIVKDLGLQRVIEDETDVSDLAPNMLEYKTFVHSLVYKEMDRVLCLAEKQQNHLLSQPFAANSMISGLQSETLGHAVSCLLTKHPSQLNRISQQLTGRQLPNSFRQLLWKIKIFQAKEQQFSDLEACISHQKQEFIMGTLWGQKEFQLNDPKVSTIDGIIQHAVREIYNVIPCFQDGSIRHVCIGMAVEVLNILYVHSKVYEPHYALLLLPLIWTYVGFTPKKEFTSTELSLMFFHFIQKCFPMRLHTFAIAETVLNRLERNDPELFQHLITSMQKNVDFNPREFLVNFLHQEKEKSYAMLTGLKENPSTSVINDDSRLLLSHPVIFIRKWIGEGFVGILDLPCVLFVWDQCFLNDWQPVILENICLVLLELLRSKLLKASDYSSIKAILCNHAFSLYTYDVQQGLAYLNNGGSILDVSGVKQESAVSSLVNVSPSLDSVNQENSEGNLPMDHDSSPVYDNKSTDQDVVQLGDLWIEKKPPIPDQKLTNKDSFHIYVDEVRFIPDNATVIKVTGRILNHLWKKPPLLDISDVEAYSILDSPARCPQFLYRYPVHPKEGLPYDSVLLLRVYTLDVDSGEMVVIGNCALDLYKEEKPEKYFLKTGGHQMRIKHELPSTVSKLKEDLFTNLTNIPVISLLIRILPYEEDFIESPGYSSGFYDSSCCVPDETESKLHNHYKTLHPYPPTVIEAIRDIREEELNAEDEVVADQQMEQWYRQRMSKQQLERKPARSLHLTRLVQYDQKQGLFLTVDQAFGLPFPSFVNAFVYISLGFESRSQGKTSEGLGGDERTLFDKRDFDSFLKSPKWINEPKAFHPYLDPCSSLIIQLYRLDAVYEPRLDRQTVGKVTAKKGKSLSLVPQGWTVLKLFDKKCVNAGLHHLPLFEGRPSSSFMEFLSSYPGDIGLREALRQDIHQLQGSSCVQVHIWDGHFSNFDYLPLPTKQDLLKLGNEFKIKKAMQGGSGKKYSDVVLQNLTKQERKLGTDGQPYHEEKQNYEEAMNEAFNGLIDNVLLDMGLGPSSNG